MSTTDFQDGYLEYRQSAAEDLPGEIMKLLAEKWTDGFCAFSNRELRLRDIGDKMADVSMFSGRVSGIPDTEGYLMELDLWRACGEYNEELVIEREDYGFLIQHWKLHKTKTGEAVGDACFYRSANTIPQERKEGGKGLLFEEKEITSVEVIVPEKRLHFFITAGSNEA